MDPGLWKKGQQTDAHKETMRSHYWYEERVYTEKEEGVSAVKGEKRKGLQVYIGTIEERVYQILKVALNSTNVLCRKKRWK